MEIITAINILKEEVEKYEFPKLKTLDYLYNIEPIIYLCGKSSTGKTTFLNTLFNFEKDELFTSTDISTKTEFRFKFSSEEKIIRADNNEISIPLEYSERKKLFKTLNEEGNKYIIYLNKNSLEGKTIVDIPGVFDFSRNDEFSNKMLNEADVIYFFTPCMAKVSAIEYDLLKAISDAGIPIVVLFTMGDITEVDEGITRKTMPKLVENRLNACFKGINISHHQIISSNDFYKGKETHGIDKLQSHINHNVINYKKLAEINRLKRTILYYKNLVEKNIIELTTDSQKFKELVHRKQQLWCETKVRDLNDEKYKTISSISSELNWLVNNCKDILYGKAYTNLVKKPNTSLKVQKEKFESDWEEFWNRFNNDFPFINLKSPKLPAMEESLFEHVNIDVEKLKDLLGSNSEEVNKSSNQTKKTNGNKKNQGSDKNKKEQLSISDFIEIAMEVGVNMSNGKILYNKYSFINNIEELINKAKYVSLKSCDTEFQAQEKNLIAEKNIRIEEEFLQNTSTAMIETCNSTLLKLNKIINDI